MTALHQHSRTQWRKRQKPPPAQPPPKGELLFEIRLCDILSSDRASEDPRITECVDIASYTWLNKTSPTIIVPGEPAAWNPPAGSRQLKPDTGDYLRDPNAAKYSKYPMEPAVRAIFLETPQFNGQQMDIVSCSSTFGNISRFVRGVSKTFRFIVDRVGNTVFFLRRENSPTQLIPDVRGYGHNFLDEYTSWDHAVRGSESHQRIIRYEFGGLRMLMRYESDGYIKQQNEKILKKKENSDVNDLVDLMKGEQPENKTEILRVEKGGRRIMMNDLIDIKTRVRYTSPKSTIIKEIDLTDITPRLWVSQIPKLVVGYHEKGRFDDIEIKPMKEALSNWETENAESLQKLAYLLRDIIQFASTSKTRLEICREGSGPLEVRRVGDCEMEALPVGLREKWLSSETNSKEAPVSGLAF